MISALRYISHKITREHKRTAKMDLAARGVKESLWWPLGGAVREGVGGAAVLIDRRRSR